MFSFSQCNPIINQSFCKSLHRDSAVKSIVALTEVLDSVPSTHVWSLTTIYTCERVQLNTLWSPPGAPGTCVYAYIYIYIHKTKIYKIFFKDTFINYCFPSLSHCITLAVMEKEVWESKRSMCYSKVSCWFATVQEPWLLSLNLSFLRKKLKFTKPTREREVMPWKLPDVAVREGCLLTLCSGTSKWGSL